MKTRKELFVPLLLYVGETFKKQKMGDWFFSWEDSLGIVEPWFLVGEGRKEAIFMDVYKSLLQN